jgi:hypothetical protein
MTPHLTDPMAPYPDEIYKAQRLMAEAHERSRIASLLRARGLEELARMVEGGE